MDEDQDDERFIMDLREWLIAGIAYGFVTGFFVGIVTFWVFA